MLAAFHTQMVVQFLFSVLFFSCKYFIITFFSCSEVDQSSFFQGSQRGNLLRILYTGILHPLPFMVILMGFCWLGKLHFVLWKTINVQCIKILLSLWLV